MTRSWGGGREKGGTRRSLADFPLLFFFWIGRRGYAKDWRSGKKRSEDPCVRSILRRDRPDPKASPTLIESVL